MLVLALFSRGGEPVPAATVRTQVLDVRSGWNALFLEVQPGTPDATQALGGLPVDSVACFLPGSQREQYVRSPGDAPWKADGWAVWYAPGRPEAFLGNLRELQGGRAYLVHATRDFAWSITGEPRAFLPDWQAGSCTFTGLPVADSPAPTFASFFDGSRAHQRLRIYRLEDGLWRLLREPARTQVQPGEAYWIQADGPSAHPGPIRIGLPARGEIDFAANGAAVDLTLANLASTRARLRVETVGGTDSLPLLRVERDLSRLVTTVTPLPALTDLGELAPGASLTLRLQPHRDALTTPGATTLLRFTDDRGWVNWVPVRARRADLAQTP